MDKDQHFAELLRQSSIGSPGARAALERVPAERADHIRRIGRLRNAIAHSEPAEAVEAARELITLLRSLNFAWRDEIPDGLLLWALDHALENPVTTRETDRVPDRLDAVLIGHPPDELPLAFLEIVLDQAAAVLGTGEIDPGLGFADLGFDSLGALELSEHISRASGLRLPLTVVFDYPDPRSLADHLAEEFTRLHRGPQASERPLHDRRTARSYALWDTEGDHPGERPVSAADGEGPVFLTVAEVADLMDVSKVTVYRLVHSGHLASIRSGRSFRIPEEAVHGYLAENVAAHRISGDDHSR